MVMDEHKPVMLTEVKQYLVTDREGVYVDATFGRGGHVREILKQLGPNATLFTFDKDSAAIDAAKNDPVFSDKRFLIFHDSFIQIKTILQRYNLVGKVKGILLDLGVSSPQLDEARRGFSFMRNGPLDMRMDQTKGITAATWLSEVSEKTLADVLKVYGEERYASRTARAIIKAREQAPITTTGQLTEIVVAANSRYEKGKHPATRTFQAIRIYINNELEELRLCLQACLEVLAQGGRLLVISFHSLEDRIVKQFFKTHAEGDVLPRKLPIKDHERKRELKLLCKFMKPSDTEIQGNSRARSAKLRIVEKI